MAETRIVGNRVIILGSPGSGKSTFAAALRDRTGLPLIHLDNIWWRADRTHITRDAFDKRLRSILQSERWIIDGDYSRTYEPRFIACDTVIFLDLCEEDCMCGLRERVGKARPDIPWTESRLDPGLAALVRNYPKENRPRVYALMEKHPGKQTLVFKTRAQAEIWLDSLPGRACDH